MKKALLPSSGLHTHVHTLAPADICTYIYTNMNVFPPHPTHTHVLDLEVGVLGECDCVIFYRTWGSIIRKWIRKWSLSHLHGKQRRTSQVTKAMHRLLVDESRLKDHGQKTGREL